MTLKQNIIKKLTETESTLSTAESLTGGGVASDIVDTPGASKVFKGGMVCYFLEVKEIELNIPKEILGGDAVNEETAILMAKNISKKLNTTYGIATTGIATSYDERAPMAYTSIYDSVNDKSYNYLFNFDRSNSRESVRNKVSKLLLKKLWDVIKDS